MNQNNVTPQPRYTFTVFESYIEVSKEDLQAASGRTGICSGLSYALRRDFWFSTVVTSVTKSVVTWSQSGKVSTYTHNEALMEWIGMDGDQPCIRLRIDYEAKRIELVRVFED